MTTKHVVIIDYGMGNVASVKKAFIFLGAKVKISHKREDIEKATHLVLPGVGAFGDGMANLRKLDIIKLVKKRIDEGVPFLGICLGMQLLAQKGYEFGAHEGLGWIDAETVRINSKERLPHVGWNDLTIVKEKPLFNEIVDNNFYFVHSFCLAPKEKSIISATCDYGAEIVASIQAGNIFATQFHPEKSQKSGLLVLENFLNYQL